MLALPALPGDLRGAPCATVGCCPNPSRPQPLFQQVSGLRLKALLAVVSLVIFGWQSALLRWRGLPAYTAQMRAQLFGNSVQAWLWLLFGVCMSRSQPPTWLVLAAAAYVADDLLKSASAAVQLWLKDDLPQRRQDIRQLEDSMAAARRMAAAGGSPASLAGAMAGRLEGTLARARAALRPIRWQPV